jgi:hypothetical protein
MEKCGNTCLDGMYRYIGHTVTIFTASGGLSGSGFTGVLIDVDSRCVSLLVSFGAAPACPLGSACGRLDIAEQQSGHPFGAICEIPISAIVCFTHNAI